MVLLFRGLSASPSLAPARLGPPSGCRRLPNAGLGVHLHPVMVDIALQALGATEAATDLAGEGNDRSAVVLPVRLAGIRVYGD